jgi:hypothetical protein
LCAQGIYIRETAVETLLDKNRQLNFDHVELGCMFGRVVKNEFAFDT